MLRQMDTGFLTCAQLIFETLAEGHSQVWDVVVQAGSTRVFGFEIQRSDAISSLVNATKKNCPE